MYVISEYSRKQAKKLGVDIELSTRKNKKLDVFKDGKLIASIGDTRYNDYHSYLKEKGKSYADERRRLYHLRHTGKTLGETLSKTLLW